MPRMLLLCNMVNLLSNITHVAQGRWMGSLENTSCQSSPWACLITLEAANMFFLICGTAVIFISCSASVEACVGLCSNMEICLRHPCAFPSLCAVDFPLRCSWTFRQRLSKPYSKNSQAFPFPSAGHCVLSPPSNGGRRPAFREPPCPYKASEIFSPLHCTWLLSCSPSDREESGFKPSVCTGTAMSRKPLKEARPSVT